MLKHIKISVIILVLVLALQYELSAIMVTSPTGKKINLKTYVVNTDEYSESRGLVNSLQPVYKVKFLQGSSFFSIEKPDGRKILQMIKPAIEIQGILLVPYKSFFECLSNEQILMVFYQNMNIVLQRFKKVVAMTQSPKTETIITKELIPEVPVEKKSKLALKLESIENGLNRERVHPLKNEDTEVPNPQVFRDKLNHVINELGDNVYEFKEPKVKSKKQVAINPKRNQPKQQKVNKALRIPTSDSPVPEQYSIPRNLYRREISPKAENSK